MPLARFTELWRFHTTDDYRPNKPIDADAITRMSPSYDHLDHFEPEVVGQIFDTKALTGSMPEAKS